MNKFKNKVRPFLIGIFFVFVAGNSFSTKKVVFLHENYVEAGPKNIVANINFIESMPFDGMVILASPDCDNVMKKGGVVTYTSVYDNNLKSIQGIFKKFNYNWAEIFTHKPGDFFDNAGWNVCINNWRMFARAVKAAGLKGIIFENEVYNGEKIWDYPSAVDSSSKYSLEQYRAQARLRGKQCMQACIEEYPNIEVTCIYGAYISEPRLPGWFLGFNYGALMGAFVVGMTEATVGKQAFVHDGGELYKYRTQSQFTMSYNWRKDTIATDAHNSPNIPASLRPYWKQKVKISHGLFNKTWPDASYPMDPTIMRKCLEYALRTCDDFVWFYPDWPDNWLIPPGIAAQSWLSAIAGARMAVNGGIHFTCGDVATIATGAPFTFTVKYENLETTPASLTYLKKPSWVNATNGNINITGTAPSVPMTDTLIAVASTGVFRDTLRLSIVVSSYFTFEAESGILAAPMQIVNDANASKGQCIITPAGSANTIFPKAEATYNFNAPTSGNYYVWIKTLSPSVGSTNNYGTFIGLNGTFFKPGLINRTANQYEWLKSPQIFVMNAGANQIIVGHGNEQVKIDQIVITNSPENVIPNELPSRIKNNRSELSQKLNLSIQILPSGKIQLVGQDVGLENYRLSVRDILGRKIWSNQGNKADDFVWNLTNSKIGKGIYCVMLQQKNGNHIENGKFTLVK